MGMQIHIRGLDLAKEHLDRFKLSMRDMGSTMGELGEMMAKYYQGEAFVSQGGVYGKPWAPLSLRTAAYKGQHWPGRGPLVRTGELQNSFGYTVSPMSVTVRNSVEVTGKHGTYNLLTLQQKGTRRGIPPRTVMALNEALRKEAEVIVVEAVSKKIEETR